MDGAKSRLKEKLDQLLREAAEVSVERIERTGLLWEPHYSLINDDIMLSNYALLFQGHP